jgi:hypothetical protein
LAPFLAGFTQPSRRGAALIGLFVTSGALVGYFAIMWSPLEGVDLLRAREVSIVAGHAHVSRVAYPLAHVIREVLGLLASQAPWIVGGAITGPLFGLLGNEWRTDRTWRSGLAIACAFCLEPIVVPAFHDVFSWLPRLGGFGSSFRFGPFQAAETTLGLGLAIGAAYSARRGAGMRARVDESSPARGG